MNNQHRAAPTPVATVPQSDRPAGAPAALRVGAWMTRPAQTVSPDTLVQDAYRLMVDAGIHHLPVVAAGQLVGIVTSVDLAPVRHPLITLLGPDAPNDALTTLAVRAVMTTPATTVTPATSVTAAAALMLAGQLHALPVVNMTGQLVGIISQTDLLRLLSTGAV